MKSQSLIPECVLSISERLVWGGPRQSDPPLESSGVDSAGMLTLSLRVLVGVVVFECSTSDEQTL